MPEDPPYHHRLGDQRHERLLSIDATFFHLACTMPTLRQVPK